MQRELLAIERDAIESDNKANAPPATSVVADSNVAQPIKNGKGKNINLLRSELKKTSDQGAKKTQVVQKAPVQQTTKPSKSKPKDQSVSSSSVNS